MSDPYVDPQSGILRNRFGLTDQESLDRAEADAVSARSILLQLNPLKGNFDSEHLKGIHAYLISGRLHLGRTLQIPLAKADYIQGGRVTKFTAPDLIEQELKHVLDTLADAHYLWKRLADWLCFVHLAHKTSCRVETGLKSPRRLKVGCVVRLRPTDFEPIHYSAGVSLRVMGGREHYSNRNRTRRICCFLSSNLFSLSISKQLLNKCLKCLKRLEVLLGTFRKSTGTGQWAAHSTGPPLKRGRFR